MATDSIAQSLTQQELSNFFNTLFKVANFPKEYAPNGLQIEGTKEGISHIAFAVTADLKTIEQTIAAKAQGLVVHHGLFWPNAHSSCLTGIYGKKIKLLVQNNINLWAYHLPLDGHLEVGNAVGLLKKIEEIFPTLEVASIEGFGNFHTHFLGVKANLKKAVSSLELEKALFDLCKRPILNTFTSSEKNIRSLGMITGSGAKYWTQAQTESLDCYITGEIDSVLYSQAQENSYPLLACGHEISEQFGIQLLEQKLKQQFPFLQSNFFLPQNPV